MMKHCHNATLLTLIVDDQFNSRDYREYVYVRFLAKFFSLRAPGRSNNPAHTFPAPTSGNCIPEQLPVYHSQQFINKYTTLHPAIHNTFNESARSRFYTEE